MPRAPAAGKSAALFRRAAWGRHSPLIRIRVEAVEPGPLRRDAVRVRAALGPTGEEDLCQGCSVYVLLATVVVRMGSGMPCRVIVDSMSWYAPCECR